MGSWIVESDHVINNVQFQFEVNRLINEEIMLKHNFGCVWPM